MLYSSIYCSDGYHPSPAGQTRTVTGLPVEEMEGGERTRRKEKEREGGMVRGKAQKPAERNWSELGRGVWGGGIMM